MGLKSGELIKKNGKSCIFCQLAKICNKAVVIVGITFCYKNKAVNACLLHLFNFFNLSFPWRLKVCGSKARNVSRMFCRSLCNFKSFAEGKIHHLRTSAYREKIIRSVWSLPLNICGISVIINRLILFKCCEEQCVNSAVLFHVFDFHNSTFR